VQKGGPLLLGTSETLRDFRVEAGRHAMIEALSKNAIEF
jgi:hypothetical protein